jgi:perosamine synthetase
LRGIAVGRYFAPIHLQPIYRSCSGRKSVLPVTEFQASRSLALPFFNRIADQEIIEVCEALVQLIRSIQLGGS